MSLGDPIRVHRARLLGKTASLVVGIALCVGLWWASFAIAKTPTVPVLIALGITAAVAVIGVSWWRDWSYRVTVHTDGLAWVRAGKHHAMRFDELAEVSEWVVNGTPAYLILQCHDGRQVHVPSNVTDHDELLAHVAVRPVSLPRARVV